MSIFEKVFGSAPLQTELGSGSLDLEKKEEPKCPPGLRQYETTVILRPNMSEDERLAFIHKYEQLLIAGGGVYVEVFNKGVFPLAYGIRKKNKAGETNTYLDGIDLLFTYFTNPESISIFVETLLRDDDVIRSSSFKTRSQEYRQVPKKMDEAGKLPEMSMVKSCSGTGEDPHHNAHKQHYQEIG